MDRSSIRLLREAGTKLGLSEDTIATSMVFFHRFYDENETKKFDGQTVTMACLFLSAKVNEEQRKARDVINIFHCIQTGTDVPVPITPGFWDRKDRLIEYETYVLRTLGYDVEVVLPHRYLLNYLHSLRAPRALAQVAWCFVNDSFETSCCLLHPPHLVACAAIRLATEFCDFGPAGGCSATPGQRGPRESLWVGGGGDASWMSVFDGKRESVEEICGVILALYEKEGWAAPISDPARSSTQAPAAAAAAPAAAHGAAAGGERAAAPPASRSAATGPSGSIGESRRQLPPQQQPAVCPPLDPALKATIEQLAAMVSRLGPAFEQTTRDRNPSNPRFRFLHSTSGEGAAYYQSLLARPA